MISLGNIYRALLSALTIVLMTSCANQNSAVLNGEVSEDTVIVTANKRTSEESAPRARVEIAQSLSVSSGNKSEAKAKSAQRKRLSWKPSTQADNNAIIQLGEDEELKPQAMEVSVQIDGFRTRVVIDGFYTNPHRRNLEGSFKFRLPDGAIPYFFAFGETATSLEIERNAPIQFDGAKGPLSRLSPRSIMQQRSKHWKAPKEAVMVAKEKAVFAYHETVARQIDPALLEWAGSGIFSAKIFPLQAQKTHRVVIAYDLDLKRVGHDLVLDLPLTSDAIQKKINLIVNKKGASNIFLNRVVNNALTPVEKIARNNEQIIEVIEGTKLNGIRLTVENHANVALLGEDEAGQFFAKQWQVDLPAVKSKTFPRAVFAIDTSLSASSDKFHLWVKLINKILTKNESELKEFAVISFNMDAHWWQEGFVKNTVKQREKLSTYLNKLILEGATDLGRALAESSSPSWSSEQFDVFLLSDGAVTWGERDAYFISESIKNTSIKQLFTYRLGASGENASLLSHLTRELGGASYQLTADTDLEQLSVAHQYVPWKIDSIGLEGATDLLVSGRPTAVYSGQLLTIAGKVLSQLGDDIVMNFSKGDIQRQVKISLKTKVDSFLAPRIYGQIAVAQLESISALERKVASAFANHFRVPGQSSSLLMLESEADYQRYHISPAEDAYVVKVKKISDIFSRLSEGFASSLSDPKKRMLDQIDKLNKMTFIDFSLPDAVSLLIEDLPIEAFRLPKKSLSSQKIIKNWLSKKYLTQLKPDLIKYDVLEKEANRRAKQFSPADALKVWSSLVEQMPADVAIIRDVAFAAESLGLYEQAFNLHLAASNLRPFEPQSYTYLAKLAQRLGKNDLALIYFEMGLSSSWSERFGDYALIHKVDYANFLRKSIKDSFNSDFYGKNYAEIKLNSLSKEIDLTGSDLIVAISWNTDRTDVDLHVIEPSGEECYYQHKKTRSGGFITKDVTQGYGPEMYVNKHAPKGLYDLRVKYYSSDRNKLGLKTKVLVRRIRHWGTDDESEETETMSLNSQQEELSVAKIRI